MSNNRGVGYAAGGDLRNLPGGSVTMRDLMQQGQPQPVNDPVQLLQAILKTLANIEAVYVTDLVNIQAAVILPVAASATSYAVSPQYSSGSRPVSRIVIQCLSGSVDLIIGTNGDYGVPQLFTIPATLPSPFVMSWPNTPIELRLRNRDTANTAQYGLLVQSGGG